MTTWENTVIKPDPEVLHPAHKVLYDMITRAVQDLKRFEAGLHYCLIPACVTEIKVLTQALELITEFPRPALLPLARKLNSLIKFTPGMSGDALEARQCLLQTVARLRRRHRGENHLNPAEVDKVLAKIRLASEASLRVSRKEEREKTRHD